MICVTCRHFEYLMRYDKSATSGRSMSKVMTSSESSLRGLSNEKYASRGTILNIWSDTKNRRHPEVRCGKWWRHRTQLGKGFRMICVTCCHFLIFSEIRKIGNIRRFDVESDYVIRLISSRAFEWYASRAAILNIWSDTKNRRHPEVRFGKWWCHRTQLGKGFRMKWVTCLHFKYFMRYEKSATSGGSMSEVMTSSDSSHRGLSNNMRHVPPYWIFNEIQKIGDIRSLDVESDDVIGLSLARPFEWYALCAAILNI